ncbi:MAG TPA: BON domain-containing protein [Rhodocyclaceae bacterium]|jgi:hyperosmotically inducible protein|nr:BON domain-containing protein [Rhodocyclaceae bacterium]
MNKTHSRFALNCLAIIAVSASLFACSKHDENVVPVVEDSVLTSNVKAALAADPETKNINLTVAAHSGVVELSGGFDSYPQLDRALTVTRGVTGVKSVDDKTVKREGTAAAAPAAVPAAAPATDLPAAPVTAK